MRAVRIGASQLLGTTLALPVAVAVLMTLPAAAGALAPQRIPDPPALVRASTPSLDWQPCEGGAECATLPVPLDYAHPHGPTIDLALLRTRASDPAHRLGSLVVNPGGPGGSGRTLPLGLRANAQQAGGSVAEVFGRYDVVGFDPRGVANSTAVRCGDVEAFYGSDLTPDSGAERQALIDQTRQFAQACATNSKALLTHVGTRDAARDLDRVRQALGESKLNYLGYSYGTKLGDTYADLFPKQVGRLVLDGAVDPKITGVGLFRQQARSLEQAFDHFAADCAANPSCAFNSGGDPASAFDRLVAQLDAAPLPTSDGRTLTASKAVTAVAGALSSRAQWGRIASALDAAGRGDGGPLLALFDDYAERRPDGTYSNLSSATVAINCADYRWPQVNAGYNALITRIRAESQRFAQAFVWEALPCAYWAAPTHTPTLPAPRRLPPTLVVGTTGDPATPYAWSQALARALPDSVLLTRQGEGHTGYLVGNACIDDAVNQYLVTGVTPPRGTRC
jgi:pimeloyl-ACP methyl ester carboxylesterase